MWSWRSSEARRDAPRSPRRGYGIVNTGAKLQASLAASVEVHVLCFGTHRGPDRTNDRAEPIHIESIKGREDHREAETDSEPRRSDIGDEALVDIGDDHAPRRSDQDGEHTDQRHDRDQRQAWRED